MRGDGTCRTAGKTGGLPHIRDDLIERITVRRDHGPQAIEERCAAGGHSPDCRMLLHSQAPLFAPADLYNACRAISLFIFSRKTSMRRSFTPVLVNLFSCGSNTGTSAESCVTVSRPLCRFLRMRNVPWVQPTTRNCAPA